MISNEHEISQKELDYTDLITESAQISTRKVHRLYFWICKNWHKKSVFLSNAIYSTIENQTNSNESKGFSNFKSLFEVGLGQQDMTLHGAAKVPATAIAIDCHPSDYDQVMGENSKLN